MKRTAAVVGRRFLAVVLGAVLALGVAVPASANAQGGRSHKAVKICLSLYDTRTQDIPEEGPTQVTGYWVPLKYKDGSVEDLPIPGFLGCVTTVKRGGNKLPVPYDALSHLAVKSQCRMLERQGAIPGYPYDFYGNPAYRARSRADCIFFLRAFHLGVLRPGPGTSSK
jgi:hypothetical protein